MIRVISYLLVILLCGCQSTYVEPDKNIIDKFSMKAGDFLLVVDVNSAKYTDYSNVSCDNSDCIIMRTWFLYEAKVVDVIGGNYKADTIKFANMQHSYFVDEATHKWYVQLRKFKSKSVAKKLSRQYYVVQYQFSNL
ncbi:hypothetical protein SOPP22_12485 [Shewanella sp. OPT22]|nr:hypothetical protein SOPP22_12485 [Shewanella sp. OPT22]